MLFAALYYPYFFEISGVAIFTPRTMVNMAKTTTMRGVKYLLLFGEYFIAFTQQLILYMS